MAFFHSPGKAILTKKLKARAGKMEIHRSKSQDTINPPTLGLSENAVEELEEELRLQAVEFKKRRQSMQMKAKKQLNKKKA